MLNAEKRHTGISGFYDLFSCLENTLNAEKATLCVLHAFLARSPPTHIHTQTPRYKVEQELFASGLP